MDRLRLLTLSAVLFAATGSATAQNGINIIERNSLPDITARVDAGIEIPLFDDFSFIANNELRFRDNVSKIDRNYLLGGFSYETCDYFSIDAAYIFMSVLTLDDASYKEHWELRHRVYLDLKGKLELGRWNLSLTERPLVNIRPWGPDPMALPKYEWLIRSKLQAEYEIPKTELSPFAFTEISNTLNTGKYGGGPFVDRIRFCLGLAWEVSDLSEIEIYYYFDIRNSRDVDFTHGSNGSIYGIFQTRKRQYIHVFGLSFNFSLED